MPHRDPHALTDRAVRRLAHIGRESRLILGPGRPYVCASGKLGNGEREGAGRAGALLVSAHGDAHTGVDEGEVDRVQVKPCFPRNLTQLAAPRGDSADAGTRPLPRVRQLERSVDAGVAARDAGYFCRWSARL